MDNKMLYNIKNCPFCDEPVKEHSHENYTEMYMVVFHRPTCYLYKQPYTLIPKARLRNWNIRLYRGR
jgi:hypothetical protein